MTKPELSTRLRDWRTSQNLTRSQAAERLGVSVKTLQDWEQASHMPRNLALEALLAKIANVEANGGAQ